MNTVLRGSACRRGGRRSSLHSAALLTCLLPIFRSPRVDAQTPRVGTLNEVRGVLSNVPCRPKSALKGTRGSIRLVRQGTDLTAWPDDSALVLDQIRVQRFTDLRFHVDGARFGVGNFFFSPELGRCPQASTGLTAVGIDAGTGEGSYRLSSRTEGSGRAQSERLILSVENGAATVEWRSGKLSVIALGREIRDSGTVFTVLVDSARNRALLYVRDGLVTMTGATGALGRTDRAFTFGRNGAPQAVSLNTDVLDDLTYHYSAIWAQPIKSGFPFWRVVGGTALGGTAAAVIWHQIQVKQSKPQGPFSGNITVRVPL